MYVSTLVILAAVSVCVYVLYRFNQTQKHELYLINLLQFTSSAVQNKHLQEKFGDDVIASAFISYYISTSQIMIYRPLSNSRYRLADPKQIVSHWKYIYNLLGLRLGKRDLSKREPLRITGNGHLVVDDLIKLAKLYSLNAENNYHSEMTNITDLVNDKQIEFDHSQVQNFEVLCKIVEDL